MLPIINMLPASLAPWQVLVDTPNTCQTTLSCTLSCATDKPEPCLEVLALICISKRVHQELPQVARAAQEEDTLGIVASLHP